MTQWFIGNLVSGKISNYLPVSDGSWETELNGPGSLQVTVPLHELDGRLNLRNAATTTETYLAVAENGIILNAGPIWSHDYSKDDATLRLSASGLWTYFQHRTVLPVMASGTTDPTGADTILSGLDTGTIIKRLIAQSMGEPGGNLPIVFQPDVAGSSSIEVDGMNLPTISDTLDDLTAAVDIEFAPQFTPDMLSIQWLLRTGTDANPQLVSPTTQVWDLSVPHGTVQGLDVTLDGSKIAGRVWETTGSGASGAIYNRYDNVSLINQGFPLLETVDSTHSDVDDPAVLYKYARELARTGSKPTELWKFQAKAEAQPMVGAYRVGDMCTVKIGYDPYIPAGSYTRRITNLSGDQDGKWVSITTGTTYSLTN